MNRAQRIVVTVVLSALLGVGTARAQTVEAAAKNAGAQVSDVETVPAETVAEVATDVETSPAEPVADVVLNVEIIPAPTATFSTVTDAVAERYFSAALTVVDPDDPRQLLIGLDTGFDPATQSFRTFTASNAAFYRQTAMDTISFLVTAPAGYYVAQVSYSQVGTGSQIRTGKQAGATTWVVGGYADDLGVFRDPTVSRTIDLTGRYLTVIPVSITTSLHAYATSVGGGSATVSLLGAAVRVAVAPLP